MTKNIFLVMCLFLLAASVMAEEIQFSGAVNTARPQYPPLYRERPSYYDEAPKTPPREIKKNPTKENRPPMTYNNFPQNYDSANQMMLMQQMQQMGSGLLGN